MYFQSQRFSFQFLGEEGNNTPFVAAAAISNPWQLKITSDALTSTFVGRELYSKTMGTNLKRVFMRQYSTMKNHPKIDWNGLKNAKYIWGGEFFYIIPADKS